MFAIFALFVNVVFALNLFACNVPSTITEPSKVSTTNELKFAAVIEPDEVAAEPLYILVPATSALLSVTVILSFGLIVLSLAFAITAEATACAEALLRVPAKLLACAADICEVSLSSKVKILEPLTPSTPMLPAFTFTKLSVFTATVTPSELSIIGIVVLPVRVEPLPIAEFAFKETTPLLDTAELTLTSVRVPYLKLFAV